MSGTSKIKVGSRKSQLALIQTNHVISLLQNHYAPNEYEFEVVAMSTIGDKILNQPLPAIGEKSLFTRELETALLNEDVDFVVHSLKDLPTTLPEGCTIGAVIKRDCPEDAMVLSKSINSEIDSSDILFGKNAVNGLELKIGSSSKRRIAMLKRCNPKLICTDIRGNLNTRFSKLDEQGGQYSAIILASAGLSRMGWSDRESKLLTPMNDCGLEDWLYAVGQGAIAVECRRGDQRILDLLDPLIDLPTVYEVIAERSLMRKLEAGCSVPLGVRSSWCDCDGGKNLKLDAIVLSIDGDSIVKSKGQAKISSDNMKTNLNGTEVEDFAGIATQSKRMSSDNVRHNLVKSAQLGLDVANEMIELGCLKLL